MGSDAEDMDARTAARITGMRAGAVRTAAYRGLRTLAKHLNAPGKPGEGEGEPDSCD